MTTNETCLYPIADALQIPLYMSKEGVALAHTAKNMSVGPWSMVADIMVHSDVIDGDSASAIVKIRKEVWAYFWYDRPAAELMMVIFRKPDGLKSMMIADFLRKDPMVKIRQNVKAVFTSKEKEGWKRAEISDLDERLTREGFYGTAASPPE